MSGGAGPQKKIFRRKSDSVMPAATGAESAAADNVFVRGHGVKVLPLDRARCKTVSHTPGTYNQCVNSLPRYLIATIDCLIAEISGSYKAAVIVPSQAEQLVVYSPIFSY